jgi:two-component system, NarL family, response regulator NreC
MLAYSYPVRLLMKKIRVMLVDDHAMVREGLRELLHLQPDMPVVGEAATGKEAVEKSLTLKPNVVVLDVSLPDMEGREVARGVRAAAPAARIVVLTAHEDEESMLQLCQAGVSGYVLKHSPVQELILAIRTAAGGRIHYDANLAGKVIAHQLADGPSRNQGQDLSDREVEVLRMVAWGHSNKEIAAALGISVKTVETYKARIAEKQHLQNRTDMVRFALNHGWMKPPEGAGRVETGLAPSAE